jgi:PAS domain S-box-containing protein
MGTTLQILEQELRSATDVASPRTLEGLVGLWICNYTDGTQYWDAAFRRITGLTDSATYDSQHFFDLVHPDDLPRLMALMKDITSDPHHKSSITYRIFRATDKEMRWVIAQSKTYMRDGDLIGIGTFQDVTELRQSEFLLRQSNEDLEQFITACTQNLQKPLVKILELATQIKATALATEQPTTIAALTEQLKIYKLFTDMVISESESMVELATGFVKYAQAGVRLSNVRLTDMNLLLSEVLEDFKPHIQFAAVKLNVANNLPTAYVDAMQIRHVFQNLILNAIKYKNGKPAEITISWKDCGDKWEFCVADNGRGIAKEDQTRIFDLFIRLNAKQLGDPSAGIGLAISRRIIERHGGKIWVKSKLGKGAKVYFTLPKTDRGRY